MATDEWLIWQLVDSAFPVGGLAHSNGLEAAVQAGLVTDGPSLEQFVEAGIRQCVRGVLGFVQATRANPDGLLAVDRQCDLFLNNHVSNRASRAQGKAFFTAASRIFEMPVIIELNEQMRAHRSPTHLAPVFGVVLGALKIAESQTQSMFLFMFVRSCLGAAVRLGVVGPLEAQRIQFGIKLQSDQPPSMPVQTAPVLDLLQATQDRLYSRLFQS